MRELTDVKVGDVLVRKSTTSGVSRLTEGKAYEVTRAYSDEPFDCVVFHVIDDNGHDFTSSSDYPEMWEFAEDVRKPDAIPKDDLAIIEGLRMAANIIEKYPNGADEKKTAMDLVKSLVKIYGMEAE